MPKINVYLPDELATAVREANIPVSAICQAALERAVRDVAMVRGTDEPPAEGADQNGFFVRFTPRARASVERARLEARAHKHDYIGTEHVLLGMLDEGANLAVKVLDSLDIDTADLRAELEASMAQAGKPPAKKVAKHPRFTPLAKQALKETTAEAMRLGHNYIGCEHILLGLLATEDGLASQVLRRLGVELRTTRMAVTTVLSGYVHATNAQAGVSVSAPGATLDEILRRIKAIEENLAV